jgi:hypothetical protein
VVRACFDRLTADLAGRLPAADARRATGIIAALERAMIVARLRVSATGYDEAAAAIGS